LGAVSPHFVSHNSEIWYESADLGFHSLSEAKFDFKKSLKGTGYTPFWQIYTENNQVCRGGSRGDA